MTSSEHKKTLSKSAAAGRVFSFIFCTALALLSAKAFLPQGSDNLLTEFLLTALLSPLYYARLRWRAVRLCDIAFALFFALTILFYSRVQGSPLSAAAFAGWSAFFLFALRFLSDVGYRRLSGFLRRDSAARPAAGKSELRRQHLILAAIWLLCLLPVVVLLWPGAVFWDACTQLYQFLGYEPLQINAPYFQTLLASLPVKLMHKLGSDNLGIFLYTILQTALFGAILSYAVHLFDRENLSFRLKLILVLMYSLNPVYSIYAYSVGKDANFSLLILLLVLFLLDILLDRESFEKCRWKNACLVAALIVLLLLRKISGVLLAFGFVAILAFLTKRAKRMAALACVMLAVTIGWYALLMPAVSDSKAPVSENLSIPLMQTARYITLYDDEIPPEEKAIIDAVIDYEAIKADYQPDISDSVKAHYRADASADAKIAYYSLWFRQLLRHPMCYLDALAAKSCGYFCPKDIGRPRVYIYCDMSDNMKIINEKGEYHLYQPFEKLVQRIQYWLRQLRTRPLIFLIARCGTYTWLAALGLYMAIVKGRKRFAVLHLPALFVLIGCVASPVNAYMRYLLPLVYLVPLLVLLPFFPSDKPRAELP